MAARRLAKHGRSRPPDASESRLRNVLVGQKSGLPRNSLTADASNNLPHKPGKLAHILLRRVERAHPTHHRLVFVPYVEEVPLLNLRDGFPRNFGEDAVRLHG